MLFIVAVDNIPSLKRFWFVWYFKSMFQSLTISVMLKMGRCKCKAYSGSYTFKICKRFDKY